MDQVETYYVKRGRRYQPVSYYDQQLMADGFPEGCHLVRVQGNSTQRRYHVEPDRARLTAAMIEAQDYLCQQLVKVSTPGPDRTRPITPELQRDWAQLVERHGDDLRVLSYPSAWDMSQRVIETMGQKAAGGAWRHPTVQSAWGQFLTACRLVGDHDAE